jgi:hypothetical protein
MMKSRSLLGAVVLAALFLVISCTQKSVAPALVIETSSSSASSERSLSDAAAPVTTSPAPSLVIASTAPTDVLARIRDEGMNRSQVPQTLSYLTDVIGPRLTGSPNLRRANEWTRDRLASWGLVNAHLEAWGPFGRGWSLKRFSAQIVEPQDIPLIAFPKAWTPGFDKPITADVVYVHATTESDLSQYRGSSSRGRSFWPGPSARCRRGSSRWRCA